MGFQRQCGLSWAFAAAAALESRLMIATSPQHIMASGRDGVGGWWWGVSLQLVTGSELVP